jgi:hypothetical protein
MIKNLKLEDINIHTASPTSKELYGEVFTPFTFINKILDIIPEKIFENPKFRWLDPGAGAGNFSIALYFKLLEHLKPVFSDIEERKDHIIKNMIYMVELQPENTTKLRELFGPNANIYEEDYLNYLLNPKANGITPQIFDVVIGNPPFNCNGLKKVPTNTEYNKKQDGKTIWSAFVIKSIGLLKPKTGILCMFIPSIWLKPDKERLYYFLTQYDIKKLNCFSNTETNKIFKGNAQTPSCFFLLTKRETDKIISIYDTNDQEYIDYQLKPDIPIPVCNISIINKLNHKKQTVATLNPLKVIKTNMPPKNTILSTIQTKETPYPNITTCLQDKTNNKGLKVSPTMVINYSNNELIGANRPKLILAHKMYGLPYLDISGEFGISNRDNYIIYKDNISDLIKLQKFLSTKTALQVFDSTRYRMKYLEKYAFQLLPDITKLPDFPEEINDETVADYFMLVEQ